MSRCFPFPPPGYARKTIADDLDLLKKEKQREKKHKKEKKDKEKREGKEKRDKDRSDEKHKEKKDKKDRHRDKKKDKEKNHDKDKHKTNSCLANEKRVVGLPGSQVPLPSERSKDRANDRSAALVEKRAAGLAASHNGESFRKNNHLAPENKRIKCAPEFVWRSTDEEKRLVNQMPEKNLGTERKKDGMIKLAGISPGLVVDAKDRIKEKATLAGKTDERGVSGETKSSGITRIANSVGMIQNRVGGAARSMEKQIEQRVEGKDKNREKEVEDGKVEKRKENDRDKEKRKEEKVKATSEQKIIEQSRKEHGIKNHVLKSSVKDENKKDISAAQNTGLQNLPRNSNHSSSATNNLGKRKDMGLNGIYDEHTTRANKMAKTTSSSYPSSMENGRSQDPCQSPAALAPAIQRPAPTLKVEPTLISDGTQRPPHVNVNIKVDAKEQKINGMITQPSVSTAKADRKPDAPPASVKPPHPDTKYLSQVLSVPKLDEWSDFDDQEWLFGSSSYSSHIRKRQEVDSSSSGVDNTPQVWAKALWLEPVDIHALPYVIPH